MLIDVTHTTRFTYAEDVIESTMEVRLDPCTDLDQRRLSFELRITPSARIASYRDGFANVVHCFSVLPPHDRLVLVAHARVETLLGNPFAPTVRVVEADPIERWFYLQFGGPVLCVPEVGALAERFRPDAGGENTIGALRGLMGFINAHFEYQAEVTNVESSVDDLLRLRKGVCQDFTHLMLAVCRAMEVPARYVSGYILSGQDHATRGDGASHAWCEAWIPGMGWRGFDPTNNVLAADSHVKLGFGRSYGDVPPTRGIYRGLAEEHIDVAVQTVRLDASEG